MRLYLMDASKGYKTRLLMEFIRLALISGLVFVVVLSLLLLVIGFIYQDRIKDLFVRTLNQRLQTELIVDHISLDLFRSFPMASVTLNSITLMESGNHLPKDTLLHARRIQFQFYPTDILRKNYTIKQIVANQGFMRIRRHADGSTNHVFWDSDAQLRDNPFQLALEKIVLRQMDISYRDKQHAVMVETGISHAVLSGLFQDESFQLKVLADAFTRNLMVDSLILIDSKPVKIDMAMWVENNSRFHFSKGSLLVNKHQFSLEGGIYKNLEGIIFNTKLTAKELALGSVIEDLPERFNKHLSPYAIKGVMTAEATVEGIFSEREHPSVAVNFHLKGGALSDKASGLRIREMRFSGSFDNGPTRNKEGASLRLSDIYSRVNDGLIRGNLQIRNFAHPYLSMAMYADANAIDLINLLRIDTVSSATGRVFADIGYQGPMNREKSFTVEDLLNARTSGTISARNLGFSIKNSPLVYHGLNGSMFFKDDNLMVESLSGNIGRSDFHLTGYFRNVLPYLFIKEEPLQVDAVLSAERIDFDELLHDSHAGTDTAYRLRFPERLGIHLQASVKEMTFRKFSAANLTGAISLQNQRLHARDIRFHSMDGRIWAEGTIDGSQTEMLLTACQAQLHRVDVHQLFHQMGNFGQTSIVEENIFGIISAGIRFTAGWSPALQIDWGSLVTDAQVRIEDGVLVNYEPMNALGRFLRVDDLSRVHFSTLENLIHINERTITIPQMQINSNVLNLKLSGRHGFDNHIEYHLEVLLSELLSRRNRERRNPQEQYGEIIDDGLGRTTLFLKVTGHIDEPTFSYDHQGVIEKLRNDFRQERESLRDALRREFNFLGRQSPEATDTMNLTPRTRRQLERERIRKQEEGNIILEWDEI